MKYGQSPKQTGREVTFNNKQCRNARHKNKCSLYPQMEVHGRVQSHLPPMHKTPPWSKFQVNLKSPVLFTSLYPTSTTSPTDGYAPPISRDQSSSASVHGLPASKCLVPSSGENKAQHRKGFVYYPLAKSCPIP